MSAEAKLTAQEQMKIDSQYLRGNILEELEDLSKGDVSDYTYELLKFHGTYYGHNRDTATERKKAGLEKEHEFMVRLRLPAGLIEAEQYLRLEELAGNYANGTLRATTRQSFQFHVVLKENLKTFIHEINEAALSTVSACGDVPRNVTTTPAPIDDPVHNRLREDALKIAAFVKPRSTGYDEVWNDQELSNRDQDTVEPLYGPTYLPRKFKIGIIVPEDNSIDVFTHDLGVVAIFDYHCHPEQSEGSKDSSATPQNDIEPKLLGYNILLGGGMGMSHEGKLAWKDKKTYPRLANPIAFVEPDDLLNAIEAVIKLQRDHGDRTDRKHARLKYVVEEQGLEWTRNSFEAYFAKTNPSGAVKDPVEVKEYKTPDHLGWHEQKDGRWFLGVPVPSGRIVDYGAGEHPSGYDASNDPMYAKANYRAAFRELCERFGKRLVVMPDANMIVCDVEEREKPEIEALFAGHHVPLREEHTNVQRYFHTCVALPTCAKALAESERVQFQMMQDVQAVLDKYDLHDEPLHVRVAGCPNGCSRPYVGDIGIVGRMPGHYVLFVGGDFAGTRLSHRVLDKIPLNDLPKAIDPMVALFKDHREPGEHFGDFCERYGIDKITDAAIAANEGAKWAVRVD